MRYVLILALLTVLAGCALDDAAPVHSVYRSPDARPTLASIVYVTDRAADAAAPGGFGTRWAATASCGQVDVTIPAAPLPGQDIPWGYITANHPTACTTTAQSSALAGALAPLVAAAAARNCHQVLVFVHGFHTGFDGAVLRAGQIGADTAYPCPVAAFSWTSEVDLNRYEVDLERSSYAQPLFAEFLRELNEAGLGVNIIGHSMGARLALATLAGFADSRTEAAKPGAKPVGELILSGADIGAEPGQNDFLRLAARAAPFVGRITLYASHADSMLALSARNHGGVARLGATLDPPAPDAVATSIDLIDAGHVPADTVGHSYYAMSYEVLADMARVLKGETLASRMSAHTTDSLPPASLTGGPPPRPRSDRSPRLISHVLADLIP